MTTGKMATCLTTALATYVRKPFLMVTGLMVTCLLTTCLIGIFALPFLPAPSILFNLPRTETK